MNPVANLARGAVAGVVGTAVMTAAQTAEMAVSGREASTVPGQVASKLFGLSPEGDEEMARVSLAMHWGHGVAQGTTRALLGQLGVRGTLTGAFVHFALMWTSDAFLYKQMGISPWPWEWSGADLAPDLLHKSLYAVATSAAYERLSD